MPSKNDAPRESQLAGTATPDRANTNAKLQSLKAGTHAIGKHRVWEREAAAKAIPA